MTVVVPPHSTCPGLDEKAVSFSGRGSPHSFVALWISAWVLVVDTSDPPGLNASGFLRPSLRDPFATLTISVLWVHHPKAASSNTAGACHTKTPPP